MSYVEEWPVTARQAEVHAAMLAHQRSHHGQGMTLRELADHFGKSGVNGARQHALALVKKGRVVKAGEARRARYVAIVPGCCPACGQPERGQR
jgi:hypothetical protein